MKPVPRGGDSTTLDIGVRHHYEADRLFHNSAFLREQSARFMELIRQQGHHPRRHTFFTAHIAVELLLDRAVMRHDVTLLDRFYLNLAGIGENDVKRAFGTYGLTGAPDFMTFVDRFRNSRYLYHYQDMGGVIFALNRIQGRVGLEPFDNQAVDLLVIMDATLQGPGLSTIEDIAFELTQHE
jgi:hypothetical protein